MFIQSYEFLKPIPFLSHLVTIHVSFGEYPLAKRPISQFTMQTANKHRPTQKKVLPTKQNTTLSLSQIGLGEKCNRILNVKLLFKIIPPSCGQKGQCTRVLSMMDLQLWDMSFLSNQGSLFLQAFNPGWPVYSLASIQ